MSQILTSINNNIFTHSPFTFEMQIEKITEFYRQKATNYISNPVIVIDILHVKKRFVLAVVVFYILSTQLESTSPSESIHALHKCKKTIRISTALFF